MILVPGAPLPDDFENLAADLSDAIDEDLLVEDVGVQTLVVETGGERLDRWLAAMLAGRSRAEVQRWIAEGSVTKGGAPLKSSTRLAAGDRISFCIPRAEEYTAEPEAIPLTIVYEDSDLLVIDKPAGMVVHPAAGNWHGTLVNAVLHHCSGLEGVGAVHRPGIVHRLDKDTSGLILVAKHDRAHRFLVEQFRSRRVEKRYVALVYGQVTPAAAEISAPIGRDPHNRKRMAVVPAERGRSAVTGYRVEARYRAAVRRGGVQSHFTLVHCFPRTGRTHQVRVHLASIGHPIVGDPLYGARRDALLPCPRQFLHAAEIRFRLPSTDELVAFSAALPAELQGVLDWLAHERDEE